MAGFEDDIRALHGPAFKNKEALLNEVAFRLCELQRQSLQAYDKDVVNKRAWKRALECCDYKTLFLLGEISDVIETLTRRLEVELKKADELNKEWI